MYDIFHMISVRLLECLTLIMWKMNINFIGEASIEQRGLSNDCFLFFFYFGDLFSHFFLHSEITLACDHDPLCLR